MNEENEKMRQTSGSVNSDSKLVSFLYTLIRDYLSAGEVETLVRDAQHSQPTEYTNGWIAKYAINLAERLK